MLIEVINFSFMIQLNFFFIILFSTISHFFIVIEFLGLQILNSIINQNIVLTDNIFIDSLNFENVNIYFDSPNENYILKVYPSNDINSYQLLPFDNNFIFGDINDDLVLNIQDIILLINIILENELYSEVADMNQDDGISILDVILLINLII